MASKSVLGSAAALVRGRPVKAKRIAMQTGILNVVRVMMALSAGIWVAI